MPTSRPDLVTRGRPSATPRPPTPKPPRRAIHPTRVGQSPPRPPTRPKPRKNAPRVASRVFWKKLLLRARPPNSTLRTPPIASPGTRSTAPPVYTGTVPPSLGAGVTANLNPTGTPRHSGRRYLPEGSGVSVLSYVLVTAVFVIVLIVVLTSLGNSIGEGLQDLVDQIPISL